MSMAYIRRHYGVPAKRGGRVTYRGRRGTILGAHGQYLRVRLDGEKHPGHYHPTWRLKYDDAESTPVGVEGPVTGSDPAP